MSWNNDNDSQDQSWIIKLRGLPWTVTNQDILDFLDGVEVNDGANGVHLITYARNSTRPNGEAFVVCASEEDYKRAFDFNKKTMGHRYIEIFSARQEDFENIMRKQNIVQHDTVVKLRGLPWRVTEKEIEDFFEGLELNQQKGVHIHLDRSGRASGEAFVQFENSEDCEKALKRNLEKIGHRYIEIFRSTAAELRRSMNQNSSRPSPYDTNDRGSRFGGNGNRMNNSGNNDRNLRTSGNNNRRGLRDRSFMDSRRNDSMYRNNDYDDNFNNGNNMGGHFNNGNNFGNGNFNSGFGNGGNGFGNNFNNGYLNRNNDNFDNDNFGGNDGGFGGNNFNNFGGNNNNGGNYNNDFNNDGNGMGMGNNNGGGGGNGYGALNTLGFGGLNDLRGNRQLSTTLLTSLALSMAGNNSGSSNHSGGGSFGFQNNRNNNDNDNSNTQFCVHLRGMPYYCDESDMYKFFAPLKPIHCKILFNNKNQCSGGGNAYFASHEEAMKALTFDREKMGSRYIELFYEHATRGNNKKF